MVIQFLTHIRFFKKNIYLKASWCKTVLNKSWYLNTNATLNRVRQNSISFFSDKAARNNCLALTHVLCRSCRACPALVIFPVSTECFKLYRSLVYCIRHCFNIIFRTISFFDHQ